MAQSSFAGVSLDAWEQDLWRIDVVAGTEGLSPGRTQNAGIDAKQSTQFCGGVRHERRQHPGQCPDNLQKVMQDFADPRLLAQIFDQGERRGLNDITIGMIERRPDGFQSAMKLQICHMAVEISFSLSKLGAELAIFCGPFGA